MLSTDILEFSSNVWLSYLKTVCSFWVLLLSFIRTEQHLILRPVLTDCSSHWLFSMTSGFWVLWGFLRVFNLLFVCLVWWTIPSLVWAPEIVPCNPFVLILSLASESFLTHGNWSVLCWISQGDPCTSPEFFLSLSVLGDSALQALASPDTQLRLFNSWETPDPPEFSSALGLGGRWV